MFLLANFAVPPDLHHSHDLVFYFLDFELLLFDEFEQIFVLALNRSIPLYGVFCVLALRCFDNALDFALDLFCQLC